MKKFFFTLLCSLMTVSTFAQVSPEEFNQFSSEFISFMNPRAQKVIPKFNLKIRLINDQRFLAYAGDPVTFSTGLINNPKINLDAVVLIMCHEIGHNITIARHYLPKNLRYDFEHLEQDYFAAYDCFEPFIKSSSYAQDSIAPSKLALIPQKLQDRCNLEHEEPEICLRALSATISTITSIYETTEIIWRSHPEPSFERDWMGSRDELQARIINFVNGIFKEKPFYQGSKNFDEEDDFRL